MFLAAATILATFNIEQAIGENGQRIVVKGSDKGKKSIKKKADEAVFDKGVMKTPNACVSVDIFIAVSDDNFLVKMSRFRICLGIQTLMVRVL